MFAAASGARLAHRHNKTAQKQVAGDQRQINDGIQVRTKAPLPRHQQFKYSDVHGFRYNSGNLPKRLAYSSKPYSSNYNPGYKLSTSYIDINGRISKLGQFDFEGKAAWQDREFGHELDRRESICVPSEVHNTSKLRQKEAHRRWVRKNRIQDLSLGDHNSDDEDFLYGVQNGAANLLLYIGLGTMCVGMIIAFVGTGEKGFKTMELRLIGPSLICAGILIIILRVLLCVCPSKCLRLNKHKHKLKNSTNKLNSEGGNVGSQRRLDEEDQPGGKVAKSNSKKRVSIAMLPTTSGLSTNPSNSSSRNFKPVKGTPPQQQQQQPQQALVPVTCQESVVAPPTIAFTENEKPKTSRSSQKPKTSSRMTMTTSANGEPEPEPEMNFELRELTRVESDGVSCDSHGSCGRRDFSNFPDAAWTPDVSDESATSGAYEFPPLSEETKFDKPKPSSSKFETVRNPKNLAPTELVLTPSALNDVADAD